MLWNASLLRLAFKNRKIGIKVLCLQVISIFISLELELQNRKLKSRQIAKVKVQPSHKILNFPEKSADTRMELFALKTLEFGVF